MPDGMRFAEHHLFARMNKTILFNVETMLFYEINPVVADIVRVLSTQSSADPVAALQSDHGAEAVRHAAAYLMKEKFLLSDGLSTSAKPKLKRRSGIRHLELMVTHDCNMRCRYCYGSHGAGFESAPFLYGSAQGRMSLETAMSGVDFLLAESGDRESVSVTFFGGEPLLELKLIEQIAANIRMRERQRKHPIGLSLSTNTLLLDDEALNILRKYRISCQVSIDGDAACHDRNRCFADGSGTYGRIVDPVTNLLKMRPGKVPARATVSREHIHILPIIEHLFRLGFGSVHIEAAISPNREFGITSHDVKMIKSQNEEAARFLVRSVRENRFFNYTNLVRFIRQTRVIQDRMAYYCGAGRTYFALSQDGSFYPCHRFVGMPDYIMGDVHAGINPSLQRHILDLTVDRRPVCRDCWARYLCGGGCWKHAVDMNGSLEIPDRDFSCEITLHLIECAMSINTELKISDSDILSHQYESFSEPYLISETGNADPTGGQRTASDEMESI